MEMSDAKSKVIKAVDSPIRLLALLAILVSASMFGIAGTMSEGLDRTIVIIGAIALLLFILIVAAFNFNEKPRILEKIIEGSFKIYDGNSELGGLWEGFVKVWKSFNDPWVMEYNTPSQFLETHKKRYASKKCGDYQFIFFLNNGFESFDRFIKFQAMVHLGLSEVDIHSKKFKEILNERINNKQLPDSLKYITVFLNRNDKPTRTFFLGFKDVDNKTKTGKEMQRVALMYLNIVNEDLGHKMILYSTDRDFWNDLDKSWDECRTNSEKVLGALMFEAYLNLTENK